MEKICDCEDFEKNMKEINACCDISWNHGLGLSEDFVIFKYCPWCGKELFDDEAFVGDSDHEHDDRIL